MKPDEEKSELERIVELIKNSEVGPPIKIYGEGRGLPNLSSRKPPVVLKKESVWQKIRDFFYRFDT